jgi:hypothetical protein
LNYKQTTEKCQHVGGQTLSISHLTKQLNFKEMKNIFLIVCMTILHITNVDATTINFTNSWSKKLEKVGIISSLKNEISQSDLLFLSTNMPNNPNYILGNNNGKLEEYLQITNTSYYCLTSGRITNSDESADIKFSKKDNNLLLNGKLLLGLQENIIKVINIDDGGSQLSLCCKACWYVHDQMDIHILDCICCFLGNGCPFSCGGLSVASTISYLLLLN